MPKLDVDEDLVRKLAALLEETGLTELEYENGPQRMRVPRNGGGTWAPAPAAPAPGGPARRQPEQAEPAGHAN